MGFRFSFQHRFFDGLHWAAEKFFRQAGYRWETRQWGDRTIGLWRKWLKEPCRDPKRLVVVPGFGDTPVSWLPVLALIQPVLSREFDEVIFFDFPAFHGFLRRERGFDSMDELFRACADVFDGLKPHTILGHSLGGWITAHYATRCGMGERPARAGSGNYSGPRRIWLASPAGVTGKPEEKFEWRLKFDRGIKEGFEAFRQHMFKKEPYYFRFLAPEFSGFFQREEIHAFMLSIRDDHEVADHLHQLKCETCLIWGEADTLSPARWTDDWLKLLPQGSARAVLLSGVGHSLQLERGPVVSVVLAQIMRGRDPHAYGARFWKVREQAPRMPSAEAQAMEEPASSKKKRKLAAV